VDETERITPIASALLQRIEALEQRVAALEAAGHGRD